MTIPKSKVFLLFCLSFILGVFLGNYLNNYIIAFGAMIFVVLASVFWSDKRLVLIGFLGLVLVFGAWRLRASLENHKANYIGLLYGQTINLEGVVVKEPDVREKQINLTVQATSRDGLVLLSVGRYPEYAYGDALRFVGKLEEPFETADFSYKNYLSRYDTYAVMRYPKVEKIGSDRGSKIKSALLAVKHKFQDVLSKTLPEPANSLLLGIILGLKRSLPKDLAEALVICGVSHIVVISGYNISIITRNLLKTRGVWGKRAAFSISVLAVLAFTILSGAEASVIRAALMGLLLVLALNIGRIYQVRNALVFTGAVMIFLNPKILRFDIGFQLSFLATLGLVYLAPIFEKWLMRVPDILSFRTNLASTFAAILSTLPLLIFYFDRISIVAPLVNVLILWTVPYTMFLGFFTGVLGMFYLPLGKLVASAAWLLLEYMIHVVRFFASLHFASATAKVGVPIVAVYYLLFISAVWLYRRRTRFRYYLEYAEGKI